MTQYNVLATAAVAKADQQQPSSNNQPQDPQSALQKFIEWVKKSNFALWLIGLVVTVIIIYYFKPAPECTKCLCPEGYETYLLVGNANYDQGSYGATSYTSMVYCVTQDGINSCQETADCPVSFNASIPLSQAYSKCLPKLSQCFWNQAASLPGNCNIFKVDSQKITLVGTSPGETSTGSGSGAINSCYCYKTSSITPPVTFPTLYNC